MPPRTPTLDPDCCPEHAHHCGRMDRTDKRLELLEEGERDHEHRVTILETEASSRAKSLAALLPIILALLSAAVAIWAAIRRH